MPPGHGGHLRFAISAPLAAAVHQCTAGCRCCDLEVHSISATYHPRPQTVNRGTQTCRAQHCARWTA